MGVMEEGGSYSKWGKLGLALSLNTCSGALSFCNLDDYLFRLLDNLAVAT